MGEFQLDRKRSILTDGVRNIYSKIEGAVNRRSLPLNALRACEAAARHLSFSKAADELCVTHAAVSHQIKLLEAQLGVTLFRRFWQWVA